MGITLAALAAGCGGKGAAPTTESAAAPVASGPATSTEIAPTSEVTTTAPEEPPCGADTFLPLLKDAFDGSAPKLTVVQAKVVRCQGGYAQVFAVPDQTVCEPGVGSCFETEQVFFGYDDGAWSILTSGTGISCGGPPDSNAQVAEICRGLGYSEIAGETFQTPSKNIGCTVKAGGDPTDSVLRCDIRSGLRPEPATPCELDWTGLVLPFKGAAKPLCAGDTAYGPSAPTLEYGTTWVGFGYTCTSETTGLSCANDGGRGFTLARAGWTATG